MHPFRRLFASTRRIPRFPANQCCKNCSTRLAFIQITRAKQNVTITKATVLRICTRMVGLSKLAPRWWCRCAATESKTCSSQVLGISRVTATAVTRNLKFDRTRIWPVSNMDVPIFLSPPTLFSGKKKWKNSKELKICVSKNSILKFLFQCDSCRISWKRIKIIFSEFFLDNWNEFRILGKH